MTNYQVLTINDPFRENKTKSKNYFDWKQKMVSDEAEVGKQLLFFSIVKNFEIPKYEVDINFI